MKKYELTNETRIIDGHVLHRIRALRSFGNVKKGDLGGFVESEDNLSHEGDAWIYDNACVYECANVSENAVIAGEAWILDEACVYENAVVSGEARVSDTAWISGYANVSDNAVVCGDALVDEHAWVYGEAVVSGNATVMGFANVSENAVVSGDAWISGHARVLRNARVSGNSAVRGSTVVQGREEKEKDIRKRAYELYQLDWMMRHGYGISDIMEGLTGEIYDEYEEFMKSTYLEQDYMLELFQVPGDALELTRRYEEDLKILNTETDMELE